MSHSLMRMNRTSSELDRELRSNVLLHLCMQLTNLKTHSTNTCNVLTN